MEEPVEASLDILDTLAQSARPMQANVIFREMKLGVSRGTLYDALRLLQKDNLIKKDNKKFYSLNATKYQQEKQAIDNFEHFRSISNDVAMVFENLEKSLQNHKRALNDNDPDVKIAQEVVRSKPYLQIINSMVRLFQVGAMMDFFITVGVLSKTNEAKAILLRKKDVKIFSRFLDIILKVEPVMWREIILLVQTKLVSKMEPVN